MIDRVPLGRLSDRPLRFGDPAASAAIVAAGLELEQPPAPGPIWTNGLAPEAMTNCPECGQAHPVHPAAAEAPPCPAFCQTTQHSTNPAAITRTHRATLLELNGHDDDDIEVPITVALERIDHRAADTWEAGPQQVILSVGTAFYAPPNVRLTRAEAVQVGMAFISGTAVMG